jgi:hypothetical protein
MATWPISSRRMMSRMSQAASASGVPTCAQARLDQRGGVQPARFQRAGHQGHAGDDVVRRLFAHRPQAVVGREIAIVVAQSLQVVAQQAEVLASSNATRSQSR